MSDRLVRAQVEFAAAEAEYMRRLNDPDGYLPTHSGPGRQQWSEAVERMKRAKVNLKAAKDAER